MEISHDDGAADLRWKMKAKRSKRLPLPPPTADEISVAESLLLLALSGGNFCDPTLLTTAPQPIFLPKKTSPSAATSTPTAANVKKQEELSPDTPLHNDDHHCSVCGQVFHSSQALGGHMTTHRARAVASEDRRRRSSAVGESGGFVHECSSCHERFPTGQALGGHKRKHYDGPPIAAKFPKIKFIFPKRPAGGESSGGGATSHDADRPVFDFDLNLPPPPED